MFTIDQSSLTTPTSPASLLYDDSLPDTMVDALGDTSPLLGDSLTTTTTTAQFPTTTTTTTSVHSSMSPSPTASPTHAPTSPAASYPSTSLLDTCYNPAEYTPINYADPTLLQQQQQQLHFQQQQQQLHLQQQQLMMGGGAANQQFYHHQQQSPSPPQQQLQFANPAAINEFAPTTFAHSDGDVVMGGCGAPGQFQHQQHQQHQQQQQQQYYSSASMNGLKFVMPDSPPISPPVSPPNSNQSSTSPQSSRASSPADSREPSPAQDRAPRRGGSGPSASCSGSGSGSGDYSSEERKGRGPKVQLLMCDSTEEELVDLVAKGLDTKLADGIRSGTLNADGQKQFKRQRRLIKNRKSAQMSRQRKKKMLAELEVSAVKTAEENKQLRARVAELETQVAQLNDQLSYFYRLTGNPAGAGVRRGTATKVGAVCLMVILFGFGLFLNDRLIGSDSDSRGLLTNTVNELSPAALAAASSSANRRVASPTAHPEAVRVGRVVLSSSGGTGSSANPGGSTGDVLLRAASPGSVATPSAAPAADAELAAVGGPGMPDDERIRRLEEASLFASSDVAAAAVAADGSDVAVDEFSSAGRLEAVATAKAGRSKGQFLRRAPSPSPAPLDDDEVRAAGTVGKRSVDAYIQADKVVSARGTAADEYSRISLTVPSQVPNAHYEFVQLTCDVVDAQPVTAAAA